MKSSFVETDGDKQRKITTHRTYHDSGIKGNSASTIGIWYYEKALKYIQIRERYAEMFYGFFCFVFGLICVNVMGDDVH